MSNKNNELIKLMTKPMENTKRVKEAYKNPKNSHLIVIKDENGDILVDSRAQSPTERMMLVIESFKNQAPTARLKGVTELLNSIPHNNKQTFLGSPTFSAEELSELQTISNQLEELLNQAVVRWQTERPTSPFEVKYPKEHKELRDNNIIRTPQKEKPHLKVVPKK